MSCTSYLCAFASPAFGPSILAVGTRSPRIFRVWDLGLAPPGSTRGLHMGARHSRGSDACPSSPEDITPQWLSKHAKLDATAVKVPEGGAKPRGRVSRVSVTPVTAEVYDGTMKSDGGGMSGSSLVRIHLYFEGLQPDATPPPKSLILKLSNFKKLHLLFQDRQLWFFAGAGPCQWEGMLAEAAFFSHQRELADTAGVRLPTTYCAMVSPARPKPPGKVAHFLFNSRSPLRTLHATSPSSHPQLLTPTRTPSSDACRRMRVSTQGCIAMHRTQARHCCLRTSLT